MVAALIDEGCCGLPTLAASACAHEVALTTLRQAFAAKGLAASDELPIT
jgi:hypothetical protein